MFKFIYNFLFINQADKTLSHTKFWSNIGYAAMTWSFIFVISEGKTEVEPMLWLIFGAIVIGNRTARQILTKETEKKDNA